MIEEQQNVLIEYLDSECSDFDMSYETVYNYEVTVKRFDNVADLTFRFNENQLQIELSEECWYDTDFFEWSVKYFWMLVSTELFK